MDKKFLVYICITIISILGAIGLGVLFYNPSDFVFPDGHDFRQNPLEKIVRTEQSSKNVPHASVNKLIAGICGLFLVGYLLRFCYLKYRKDSKADSLVLANALHKISLESGRTEYELFEIAAEEWSITRVQIDEDFRKYMAANVLPHYVMDLVRKNNERINELLIKEEERKTTSGWDLVIALLLFPGVFLFFFFLIILLPKW